MERLQGRADGQIAPNLACQASETLRRCQERSVKLGPSSSSEVVSPHVGAAEVETAG